MSGRDSIHRVLEHPHATVFGIWNSTPCHRVCHRVCLLCSFVLVFSSFFIFHFVIFHFRLSSFSFSSLSSLSSLSSPSSLSSLSRFRRFCRFRVFTFSFGSSQCAVCVLRQALWCLAGAGWLVFFLCSSNFNCGPGGVGGGGWEVSDEGGRQTNGLRLVVRWRVYERENTKSRKVENSNSPKVRTNRSTEADQQINEQRATKSKTRKCENRKLKSRKSTCVSEL